MKKILALMLALVLVIAFAVVPVSAAGKTVSVDIADYPIALNGQKMDNAYAAYPLILYNQITYFPMTYYDCRFMGVTTDWNQSTATLKIDATGVSEAYHATTQNAPNPKSAAATVADYNIIINGKTINNASEEYPLLNFRDVTYFPMTWRFCVDEFAWKYNYTNETGLAIASDATLADNPPVVNPTPAGNAITITQAVAERADAQWNGVDHYVTMSKLPTSVDDLKNYFDITDEYIAAAALFATLARFETDFDAAVDMLDYMMGPESPSRLDKEFLRDRMNWPYVMRSYFEGATVENDYTPSAYKLTFHENSYSRDDDGYVRLWSPSNGADEERVFTLRQKKSTREWFVFADSFKGPMTQVREPASLDPWK